MRGVGAARDGGPRDLAALAATLGDAERVADVAANRAHDPVRYPRAYLDAGASLQDIEVAAVVAAQLAYGRVDLFLPVVGRVLAVADRFGGPARFVRDFDDARAAALDGIAYRWNRTEDFVLLFRTLRAAFATHGSLGAVFAPGPAATSLDAAVERLLAVAPAARTRGFRTWFARPSDGSACKRWLMLLRWMVRGGSDLGVWTHLSPRDLVMPLDTHVARISRFLGLTRRPDASWRTAEEVTAVLRRIDPEDPVRFDFALAHLGISGACRGHRDAAICPSCPLDALCTAA